ncbi:F0F1 ATP synthase subunit B' [Roseicyclus sp.]|uniref:F0F1 ATP synthase subunit B' n=1 Tax=Roseicyclus sp. TaxID=1914329 RepID=UPI001BD05256|nr:F0F1 ATP synthase subunit B' [Roseicyclus sp.]
MAENVTNDSVSVAHASGPGMPQLDFATFPNQIFWLVIALVAIYFILSRIALPRIAAVLAERQGALTNDLAAAEELKQRAVAAEAAYQKALADARSEASKIADETRAAIQADLGKAIARADDEIAAKTAESEARITEIRAGALRSIEDVAADVAGDIVSAVAPGQKVDAKALAAAVAARVKG